MRDLKVDLETWATMRITHERLEFADTVVEEALTRAIAAEELCAAFREELAHKHNLLNDYKLAKDKLEEKNDQQRQAIQNLSCQVAGLREGLKQIVNILDCNECVFGNMNELCQHVPCSHREMQNIIQQHISSPDPGEKHRRVIEAAKEAAEILEDMADVADVRGRASQERIGAVYIKPEQAEQMRNISETLRGQIPLAELEGVSQ